jgi:hypothetical protein
MATVETSGFDTDDLGDQPFYLRVAYLIVAVTVVGFVQFSARGLAHPLSAPWWVHLHGLTMAGWLVLFMVQNHLAASGAFGLHRRLGVAGAVLTGAIVLLGSLTAIRAMGPHHAPPIFSPGYFLSLITLQMVLFPTLVSAAILMRRHPQVHRRLMFGALLVICGSPGLERMMPLNLLTSEQGEWLVLAVELVLLGVMAQHDRKTIGRVHPATLTVVGCILAAQLLPSVGARVPSVQAIASGIAAGGA